MSVNEPTGPDGSCERYGELLDELVDGTIDRTQRAAIEAHLAGCPECRARVTDLEKIRSAASALERRTPPPHLWDGIAATIDAEKRAGRGPSGAARGTDWRWLAVAAALILITGTVLSLLWMWRPTQGTEQAGGSTGPEIGQPAAPRSPSDPNARPDEIVESIEAELRSAEQHYENAIAGLEQIAKAEQGTLDPLLAETLRTNMDVIDRAIGESRSALRAEPASGLARQSLFEVLRRKVSLLQDTIVLMNEMRKGNEAGAARVVEGINKS